MPLIHSGKLYNCAVVIYNGSVLGVVPKKTCLIIMNFMNSVILPRQAKDYPSFGFWVVKYLLERI